MPLDEFVEEVARVLEKKETAAAAVIQLWGGASGLEKKLATTLIGGLPKEDNLEERRAKYGENKFPVRPPKSFFELFSEALQDKTLIILMISAVVSIFLGVVVEGEKHGWIEGTAIIVAVLLVASVTAGNDYSKEKQFRKLNEASENLQVKIIRGGEQNLISVYDILVGDVVLLETGDKIPADGITFECDELKVDESSMTGESESIKKSVDKDPWLLCGCQIVEGKGKMLVLAVGPQSQWGKIKALIVKESEATPLQQHLEELAETIGKMGLTAATFTFITLFVQWLVRKQHDPEFAWTDLSEVVEYLITAITIVVVAVPEGLPLAVTISLAYSMFKMMRDNNLVRHLEACETMGGATNICSDKTGTLTENKMTVTQVFLGGKTYDLEKEMFKFPETKVTNYLATGIAVNSSAYLIRNENSNVDFVGSKTECALLQFIENEGKLNYKNLRDQAKVKKTFPFSSLKKSMTTVLDKQANGNYLLYTKGASEVILEKCQFFLDESGNAVPLSPTARQNCVTTIGTMADLALRTIALAYAEIPEQADWSVEPAAKLVLIAICGIKDPVRKEVPTAVKACQGAGITVRMLTGDNIATAKAIARECGILNDQTGIAIEGPQFRKMSNTEIDAILPRLQVMARSSPQDKYRLVQRLRQLGEVVAVTGDGTNDAPQLKEADVGFSMGIAGTEVAKDASDIILLDDNFSSIVKAAMWGRNVYDSIRKFVQFQLTVNIVAVLIAFVGAVANGVSPLKPVQMLWVNLIMDTMAALALATESPTPELLQRKPYGRFESIITPAMWRNIVGQAVFQIGVLFMLLYNAHNIPQLGLPADLVDWTSRDRLLHGTIIFNTFVFCQLFNEFNARKLGNEFNVLSGVFRNNVFIGIMIFTVGVQYLIVQFGGEFTQTIPLSKQQWLACLAIAGFTLPWGAFLRLIPTQTAGASVVEEVPADVRPTKETNLKFRSAAQKVIASNSVLQGLRKRSNVNRF